MHSVSKHDLSVRERVKMPRANNVYSVILVLFWFSLFTYVLVCVRYRSYLRRTDDGGDDLDVHSEIVGALSPDDPPLRSPDSESLIVEGAAMGRVDVTTREEVVEVGSENIADLGAHIDDLKDDDRSNDPGRGMIIDQQRVVPLGQEREQYIPPISQDLVKPSIQPPNPDIGPSLSLSDDDEHAPGIPDSDNDSLQTADQDQMPSLQLPHQNNVRSLPLSGPDIAVPEPHVDESPKMRSSHSAAPPDIDAKFPGESDVYAETNDTLDGFDGQIVDQGRFHQTQPINPKRFSQYVTNDMVDYFQVKLPPLLANYKNPCWTEDFDPGFSYKDSFFNRCNVQPTTGEVRYRDKFVLFESTVLARREKYQAHWRVRCFPYFFLLGVGKSGTTDLFVTLKTYSKELAPIFLKEPHFWEWKRCHNKMHCGGRRRNPSLAEYLDALDLPSERIRMMKSFAPNGTEYHKLIIGDFTPSTLTFHPCWQQQPGNQGHSEPLYMNAHYIHSIRPETKFIVMMRDPVERIFSNYKMKFRLSNRQGDENARMFHDEMVNATSQLTECMKTNTSRACAYGIMRFDYMTHVSNSMYEIFIRDWLAVFPRDQFLFLRMEDYMENRVPNVKAILDFLGLEKLTDEQEREVASKIVSNRAPTTSDMFDTTRQLLQDFFRPFNQRLAELLANDGFTWGY